MLFSSYYLEMAIAILLNNNLTSVIHGMQGPSIYDECKLRMCCRNPKII